MEVTVVTMRSSLTSVDLIITERTDEKQVKK